MSSDFKNFPVPPNGNVNAPSTPDGQNFHCPSCGCRRASTVETRKTEFRGCFFIMRVRHCEYCGYHYRTKEVTVNDDEAPRKQFPSVQKKWDTGTNPDLDEDIERQKKEPPRELVPGDEPPPRPKVFKKKPGRKKKGSPPEKTTVFPEIEPQ